MRSRELTAIAVNRIRGPAGIIGMIALMVLVAACSGNGDITVDDLTGTWRAIEPGSYVQFNADGTYRIASSIDSLEDSPVEEGEYTLEGTLFTFISSDESTNCEAGQRGVYEMERSGEDGIRMVRQEDECRTRSNRLVNLERLP